MGKESKNNNGIMQIKTTIENLENYKKYLNFTRSIKQFLDSRGYLDVEVPVLSPALIPESSIEVFATDFVYKSENQKLFLTPSPELFIKRLLVEGVGDCYYLGKSFRNYELQGSLHSIEFNMLEFYKVGTDYMGLADELLKMLQFLDSDNVGIIYKGSVIKFDKWDKITVAEAFGKYANINEETLFDHSKFLEAAKLKGYQVEGFDYEEVFSQMYTNEVEKKLGIDGYPTLLYDYPKEFASLAKMNKDGKTSQRFEFYIGGVELGNCYSELANVQEQKIRFEHDQEQRKQSQMNQYPTDTSFLKSLEKGLPVCSGIAIGVERLAMVLLGLDGIEKMKLINIK